MSYLIADIEASEPCPSLQLTDAECGFALVVRWNRRPIGFTMQRTEPGCRVPAEQVAKIILQTFGQDIARERLRACFPTAPARTCPSITLAVCTKDRPAYLARCLDSLSSLHVPPGCEVEVLVVDNAPSDQRTLEATSMFPAARYAVEPKPGLDFARNKALRLARGDWIAYFDDDICADARWLTSFHEALCENPDAGGVTGLVLPLELETEAQILFERNGGFRRGFDKIRYGYAVPGNPLYPCGPGIFGTGANMAFRRDALLELDGFDEALDTGRQLPGGGDLDIYYRVVRAGHPLIYTPGCLVFHEHRRTHRQLARQYWSWGAGLMAFIGKTYAAEPAQRRKFRQLILWCWKMYLRRLAARIAGRGTMPVPMIFAEAWGATTGLLGEYGRSQRRVAAIREQHT